MRTNTLCGVRVCYKWWYTCGSFFFFFFFFFFIQRLATIITRWNHCQLEIVDKLSLKSFPDNKQSRLFYVSRKIFLNPASCEDDWFCHYHFNAFPIDKHSKVQLCYKTGPASLEANFSRNWKINRELAIPRCTPWQLKWQKYHRVPLSDQSQ